MAAVVADASVLIALAQIDRLSLLEQLFGEVLIPSAVAREVSPGLAKLPPWVRTHVLDEPPDPRVAAASLDAGETEAIALALVVKAERINLDDLPARRLALALATPHHDREARKVTAARSGSGRRGPGRTRS